MMTNPPLVSIIITNYNYGDYLAQAIDSALTQTYDHTEVIVVDDGSQDQSRSLISDYRSRIKTVFKENGGQGSAFNAGFQLARGEIIIFLDADDFLSDAAASVIVKSFDGEDIAKAHWSLYVVDKYNCSSEKLTPSGSLPEGDLFKKVIEGGPNAYLSPPTSGNAWHVNFLKKVMPMPLEPYTISADNYLCMLAPVYGKIKTIYNPLSYYRMHGNNNFRGKTLNESLLREKIVRFDASCQILYMHLAEKNVAGQIALWKEGSWLYKLQKSISEIKEFVKGDEKFILADGDQWQVENEIAGRYIIPFKEKDKKYWGPPVDDDDAIFEIQRHLNQGVGYIFFTWTVFWWFDHYKKMVSYLRESHTVLINNDRLIGFKLNKH